MNWKRKKTAKEIAIKIAEILAEILIVAIISMAFTIMVAWLS